MTTKPETESTQILKAERAAYFAGLSEEHRRAIEVQAMKELLAEQAEADQKQREADRKQRLKEEKAESDRLVAEFEARKAQHGYTPPRPLGTNDGTIWTGGSR
jgi:hypothetical protein